MVINNGIEESVNHTGHTKCINIILLAVHPKVSFYYMQLKVSFKQLDIPIVPK